MSTLSLFNGMSFCKMALDTIGLSSGAYYSCEIDKYANQATQAMFPDTIQLGDIASWREWDINWSKVNLVTGGFPCQPWSMAGGQMGDKDERGMLFWTMLDIIKHVKHYNPDVQFLIENVKMKKEFEKYITTHTENALGKVYKVLINSALVSAQNRNRYYWTSFEVGQPEDKGIMLKDIIEHGGEYTYMSDKFINRQKGRKCLRDDLDGKAVNLSAMEYVKNGRQGDYIKCGSMIGRKINPETGKRDDYNPALKTVQRIEIRSDEKTGTLTTVQKDNLLIFICGLEKGLRLHDGKHLSRNYREGYRIYSEEGKAATLTAQSKGGQAGHSGLYGKDDGEKVKYRKLTPRECFRLQTVPEYLIDILLADGISNTQLYKMCGNGWTHDVIVHIFKAMIDKQA